MSTMFFDKPGSSEHLLLALHRTGAGDDYGWLVVTKLNAAGFNNGGVRMKISGDQLIGLTDMNNFADTVEFTNRRIIHITLVAEDTDSGTQATGNWLRGQAHSCNSVRNGLDLFIGGRMMHDDQHEKSSLNGWRNKQDKAD